MIPFLSTGHPFMACGVPNAQNWQMVRHTGILVPSNQKGKTIYSFRNQIGEMDTTSHWYSSDKGSSDVAH